MEDNTLQIECSVCGKLLYKVEIRKGEKFIYYKVICSDCFNDAKDDLIAQNHKQTELLKQYEYKINNLMREVRDLQE